jgi:hypothetical protein
MFAHFSIWSQVSLVLFTFEDIDDVNKALAQMHEQVEQRVNANEFQSHLLD